MQISLGFDSIQCQGCGEKRQRGLDCPDCGARAAVTEVDFQYQNRIRALEPVKRLRESPGVVAWTRVVELGLWESGAGVEHFFEGLRPGELDAVRCAEVGPVRG